MNGHQEEDTLLFREEEDGFRERSLGRRRRTSSHGIAPQKPNRRTPHTRFVGGRGFLRHLLSRCSVLAEVRDGESQRTAEMWSLESEEEELATGREKASGGTQEMETQRDGNWRNQLASTIKERNSHNYMD